MSLQGVQSVFQKILYDPLEQSRVDRGAYRCGSQSVVCQCDVARDAFAEIHYRVAHHFVDVGGGEHRLGADLREAVDDLHQVREILAHLVDGYGVDGLAAQILQPPQQRGGGGA